MDNASECDEIHSTLPLIFQPKSLVLFGDVFRKSADSLCLDDKYSQHNLNQSMFKRMHDLNQFDDHYTLKLEYCYRFTNDVLSFLNESFYNQTLRGIPFQFHNEFKALGVFHDQRPVIVNQFLIKLLDYISPRSNKYGIILPPNINMQHVDLG